jgi:hypothetical protein
MPDTTDQKKQAAQAYQDGSQAYIDSQKAKADAAKKIADNATKQAAPGSDDNEMQALFAKVKAGTATQAEKDKLNALTAQKNPIQLPVKPPMQAGQTPQAAPAQQAAPAGPPAGMMPVRVNANTNAPLDPKPVSSAVGYVAQDENTRAARWKVLDSKLRAGSLTPSEKQELAALTKSAPEMQPGYLAPPTQDQAAKAIAEARGQGATGYLDPQGSLAAMDKGGDPAVYRDFPVNGSGASEATAPEAPNLSPKKQSAVDKILADMKAETGDGKDKPTIWDVLQAAAAGWNFQTPAYIEKQKAKQSKQAEIEKLSKTAQFERALQEDSQANARELEAMREENALKLAGLKPLAGVTNLSKGQQLGIGLLQGVKGK